MNSKQPKIPSIKLKPSQITNNKISDLNKSIIGQLDVIKNINLNKIDESTREFIEEALIATDILINDCHEDPDFQENRNSNIINLIYEYHKLAIKFETYNLEEKVKQIEEKSKAVGSRTEKIEEAQKGIMTNIISIILAVTIIPTALSAVEMILPNYILAFVSTLILFAMIMIIFTYYAHNSKPSNVSLAITIAMIAITIILWLLTWEINISMKPKDNPAISISTIYE